MPGLSPSELRAFLIQANETIKALSARLDVFAADAAAERNKKVHRDLDRSPTRYKNQAAAEMPDAKPDSSTVSA